jgi:hypothetical protein
MEQKCYQNESRLEKTDYKEQNKNIMNELVEKIRKVDIKDIELVQMRDTINKMLLETKTKMCIFEESLLTNKKIEFKQNNSKEFGQLIVTQCFNYFQLAEEYGKFVKMFGGHEGRVYCIE